ncbi:electron transfer flavoprotein regulatory factor 1 [Sabethes cyaneus]|uniref:electron transfer flavoprotein regulatory factor 1 n=1 Tax=Sabethes cyaneus TaxID=53552 RepID=UPI00221E31F3|nr:electron transfer flavoprotein regulatory factor 1 [Sabethes cyaneus]
MSGNRRRVLDLYKRLQYLGREYPGGADKFRQKCYNAFKRQSVETDPEKIEKSIALGEYVVKEIEALYSLRKYRAMKKRYYDN